MPTPFDYETNPEGVRLATRVSRQYLTATRSLYELLAEVLAQLGPRRILDIGCGRFIGVVVQCWCLNEER